LAVAFSVTSLTGLVFVVVAIVWLLWSGARPWLAP
jgi:hypothetical protein